MALLTLALLKCVHQPYLRHIFFITKIYRLLQLIMLKVRLLNWAISIDSYTSVKKFKSFLFSSILINTVILLLNCLVLIHIIYQWVTGISDAISIKLNSQCALQQHIYIYCLQCKITTWLSFYYNCFDHVIYDFRTSLSKS